MRLSLRGRPPRPKAIALIQRALDAGVRLLDTAAAYGRDEREAHHNERLVAAALAGWHGPRGEVIVATKVGVERPGGRWVPNGHPRHLRAATEESLRALGVETLDLLQLHAVDRRVPLADSLGALAELAREGKARTLGISGVDGAQLAAALQLTDLAAVQLRLSPFYPAGFSDGAWTLARDTGLLIIAHSPLGGYRGVQRVAAEPTLAAIARRHRVSPHQVALAWLLSLHPRLLPIPGATTARSVDGSAAAARLTLDHEDLAALAARFPFGHADAGPAKATSALAPPTS